MAITIAVNGWCTPAQVAARIPHFSVSATSTPTDAQVEVFITERFEEINAYARQQGWTIADLAGDTNALAWLRGANTLGAVADTLAAIGAGVTGSEAPAIERYEARYQRLLEDLGAGRIDLGATKRAAENTSSIGSRLRTGGLDATPAITRTSTF